MTKQLFVLIYVAYTVVFSTSILHWGTFFYVELNEPLNGGLSVTVPRNTSSFDTMMTMVVTIPIHTMHFVYEPL